MLKKKKWQEQEIAEKERIEIHNQEIDKWKDDCVELKEEAIKRFINNILKENTLLNEVIVGNECSFNKEFKKIVVDVQVRLKDDIFKYEGYKYIKQNDTIEPVSMKKTLSNQKMRTLMINLCISIFILIFKNNDINAFEEVIVNVYHNRVCCVSGKMNRDTYNELNFNKEEDLIHIENHLLKIYKQITTGVKPIEEAYLRLF